MAGAGTAAAGGLGCASLGALTPPVALYSPADMKAYLARLDHSMGAVSTVEAVEGMLPQGMKRPNYAEDPELQRGDLLFRKTVRALLLSGSFHDLSEEDRMHPGMQERMWRSMGEMDEAMLGMNDMLAGLTPTEHADLAESLRTDPDLGMRVVEVLDTEAVKAGVPLSRRMQLRTIAVQTCARLKQSPSLFIGEYSAKVQKIAARDGSMEETQRKLVSRMGEQAFWAYRDRLTEASRRWDVALGNGGPGFDVPPGYGPVQVRQGMPRGTISIIVGGSLLGLGAILAVSGGIILGTSGNLGGAVAITVGASLALGGLITLIVGLVQRYA